MHGATINPSLSVLRIVARPNSVVYWFLMQVAMIVGFLTTYPANWLLIRRGVRTEM
ncbi:MAG TPA: DUF4396 domain-containing protein [Bryobacteraceae bacterium]|jgi:hypothetical protein|nr:DUF4396 domain-containing protein [Bryobacteraceae bacterium]